MHTNLQAITAALPLGSVDAYVQMVNQIPLLSAEEEQELATRLHNDADVEAARKLVLAHLRYVVKIARGYLGYGLPLADLIQEGNVGLMKAVKRFDLKFGVRLVSFAVHWIKAEIHEFVLRNWRIVKIATTKAQRKLFFNLRNAKRYLEQFSATDADTIAKDLDVSRADVDEMNVRMGAQDTTFEQLTDQTADDKANFFSPEHYLSDQRYDPAVQFADEATANDEQGNLQQALMQLDTRSQAIVQARWLNEKKATLQDLAAQYGVSAERIRQLEQAAMKKLKKELISQN